jgi:hypothetical protein
MQQARLPPPTTVHFCILTKSGRIELGSDARRAAALHSPPAEAATIWRPDQRLKTGSQDQAPRSSASTRSLAGDLLARGRIQARFPREGGPASRAGSDALCRRRRGDRRRWLPNLDYPKEVCRRGIALSVRGSLAPELRRRGQDCLSHRLTVVGELHEPGHAPGAAGSERILDATWLAVWMNAMMVARTGSGRQARETTSGSASVTTT